MLTPLPVCIVKIMSKAPELTLRSNFDGVALSPHHVARDMIEFLDMMIHVRDRVRTLMSAGDDTRGIPAGTFP